MYFRLMFKILLITLTFCITNALHADTNLLLGDFTPNISSKANRWSVRHKFTVEKGYKEAKAICLSIEKNKRKVYVNVLTYIKSKVSAGIYEYSAYIKFEKNISLFQVVVYYKGKAGKNIYKAVRLKKADYPEPGQWLHFVAKIKLPEISDRVNFAFEARAKSADAKVWISSPALIFKNN